MANDSDFDEATWLAWLEPFQAIRLLMGAGLEDREHAVNWLKARLRNGQLLAGCKETKIVRQRPMTISTYCRRIMVHTWANVSAIPWKDDFWISGDFEALPWNPAIKLTSNEAEELLEEFDRKLSKGEVFGFDLQNVRFAPWTILDFCQRSTSALSSHNVMPAKPSAPKGGRPPKAFWDRLWVAITAQIYNGDLQPSRQADLERAMHDWLAANGEDAGETAVRLKAKLLWEEINREVEN